MRLWHYEIIPHLPEKQLLGQHRECAALRGNGWGRKHSTVDYVFTYSPMRLYYYHCQVMIELIRHGTNIDCIWFNPLYRGKNCQEWDNVMMIYEIESDYLEHDKLYLAECILNLLGKNKVLNPALDGKTVMK